MKKETKNLKVVNMDSLENQVIETIEATSEAAPTVETVSDEEIVVEVELETPRLGRPIDPNSPRQIKLRQDAELRAAGILKRGRPTVAGCVRQEKLAKIAEKVAAGEVIKRGRPTVAGSPRQIRLAKIAEKIEKGIEIKPGRPKVVKEEVVVIVKEIVAEEVIMPEIEVKKTGSTKKIKEVETV